MGSCDSCRQAVELYQTFGLGKYNQRMVSPVAVSATGDDIVSQRVSYALLGSSLTA